MFTKSKNINAFTSIKNINIKNNNNINNNINIINNNNINNINKNN